MRRLSITFPNMRDLMCNGSVFALYLLCAAATLKSRPASLTDCRSCCAGNPRALIVVGILKSSTLLGVKRYVLVSGLRDQGWHSTCCHIFRCCRRIFQSLLFSFPFLFSCYCCELVKCFCDCFLFIILLVDTESFHDISNFFNSVMCTILYV